MLPARGTSGVKRPGKCKRFAVSMYCRYLLVVSACVCAAAGKRDARFCAACTGCPLKPPLLRKFKRYGYSIPAAVSVISSLLYMSNMSPAMASFTFRNPFASPSSTPPRASPAAAHYCSALQDPSFNPHDLSCDTVVLVSSSSERDVATTPAMASFTFQNPFASPASTPPRAGAAAEAAEQQPARQRRRDRQQQRQSLRPEWNALCSSRWARAFTHGDSTPLLYTKLSYWPGAMRSARSI